MTEDLTCAFTTRKRAAPPLTLQQRLSTKEEGYEWFCMAEIDAHSRIEHKVRHDRIMKRRKESEKKAPKNKFYSETFPEDFGLYVRVPADVIPSLKHFLKHNINYFQFDYVFVYVGQGHLYENGICLAYDKRSDKVIQCIGKNYSHELDTRKWKLVGDFEKVDVTYSNIQEFGQIYASGFMIMIDEEESATYTVGDIERMFWVLIFNRVYSCAWWHLPNVGFIV